MMNRLDLGRHDGGNGRTHYSASDFTAPQEPEKPKGPPPPQKPQAAPKPAPPPPKPPAPKTPQKAPQTPAKAPKPPPVDMHKHAAEELHSRATAKGYTPEQVSAAVSRVMKKLAAEAPHDPKAVERLQKAHKLMPHLSKMLAKPGPQTAPQAAPGPTAPPETPTPSPQPQIARPSPGMGLATQKPDQQDAFLGDIAPSPFESNKREAPAGTLGNMLRFQLKYADDYRQRNYKDRPDKDDLKHYLGMSDEQLGHLYKRGHDFDGAIPKGFIPDLPPEARGENTVTSPAQKKTLDDPDTDQRLAPMVEGQDAHSVTDAELLPETRSPEFRQWFGESQVADAQGQPLKVYHGTTSDFDAFDPSKGLSVSDKIGSWFSTDPKLAEERLKRWEKAGMFGETTGRIPKKGRTIPAYLSIKNPMKIATRDQLDETIAQRMVLPPNVLNKLVSWLGFRLDKTDRGAKAMRAVEMYRKNSNARKFINKRALNAVEMGVSDKVSNIIADFARKSFGDHDGVLIQDDQGQGPAYVAFAPTQIKSATANSGRYDPNNPRIDAMRDQPGGATEPAAKPLPRTPQGDQLQRQIASKAGVSLEAAGIPEHLKPAYHRNLNQVLGQMPESVIQTIHAQNAPIVFHADAQSLADALGSGKYGAERQRLAADLAAKKDKLGGVVLWDGGKVQVLLDGGQETGGGLSRAAAEYYAHELTHVLDGNYVHSGSDEWRKAWLAEFHGETYTTPDGNVEPVYSATSPAEGFAELGRAIYSGLYDQSKLAGKFPQAYAYFVKNGLANAVQGEPGGEPVAEVFERKVPLDRFGGHTDVVRKDATDAIFEPQAVQQTTPRSNKLRFTTRAEVDGHQFEFDAYRSSEDEPWDVTFDRGGVHRQIEDGTNPVKVFSFVANSLRELLKQKESAGVSFSANAKEPSRIKLYHRLANRLARQEGMDLDIDRDSSRTRFTLMRPEVEEFEDENGDMVVNLPKSAIVGEAEPRLAPMRERGGEPPTRDSLDAAIQTGSIEQINAAFDQLAAMPKAHIEQVFEARTGRKGKNVRGMVESMRFDAISQLDEGEEGQPPPVKSPEEKAAVFQQWYTNGMLDKMAVGRVEKEHVRLHQVQVPTGAKEAILEAARSRGSSWGFNHDLYAAANDKVKMTKDQFRAAALAAIESGEAKPLPYTRSPGSFGSMPDSDSDLLLPLMGEVSYGLLPK